MIIELIGYLGSALVVFSMLMTSIVKLRVVNTVGCVIFTAYAFVIGSYPTAVMNLCLMGINVFQLFRLFRDQKQYDLIDTDLGDGYVSYFLEKNSADIRAWFPDFSAQGLQADLVLLACCNNHPASVFIGKRGSAPGETEILLDYAAPAYRDTSVGRFLYARLKQRGLRTLVFKMNASKHVDYMTKMGYRKDGDDYVLKM